jgi:hypothetical protein
MVNSSGSTSSTPSGTLLLLHKVGGGMAG